jgi:hypothetical protein
MGEAHLEKASIRVRVRQMLETGALPCDEQGKVWAGRGVSAPIAQRAASRSRWTDIEFEVDLASGLALRLHRECHEIWREECDTLQRR